MAKTKSKNKNVATTKPQNDSGAPMDTGEAIDEMTGGEKLLLASKPYWAHILLGVLSLILVWVLYGFYRDTQIESASEQWRSLSNAMTQAQLSEDVSSLKTMGDEFPDQKAGNWALQMAGNFEINRGIDMLASDRIGGLKMIENGMNSIQKVVDASANSKSPMLQRRSLFLLAYSKEALGKFEEAKKLYTELVESAPDSEYVGVATRGIARCSNPDFKAVYEKFRTWEEATEDAPGPLVPGIPGLNFDDIELPTGEPATLGGNDFKPADMTPDEAQETAEEKPAAETSDEPVETKAEPAKEAETTKEAEPAKESEPTKEAEPAKEAEAAKETEPAKEKTEAAKETEAKTESEGVEASSAVEAEATKSGEGEAKEAGK